MRVIIFLMVAICLSSCTAIQQRKLDNGYSRVATDVDPTPRNKKILLDKCQTVFPIAPPTVTPGIDIVHTDTNQVDTNAGIIRDVIKQNCPEALNVDSLTDVIRNSVKPIVIDHWHERVDTIDRGDSYAVKNVLMEKAKMEKDNDRLQNENVALKASEKKNKIKMIAGWVAFALVIIAYLVRLYFKITTKI